MHTYIDTYIHKLRSYESLKTVLQFQPKLFKQLQNNSMYGPDELVVMLASLVLNHETSALLWVRKLLLEDEPNTVLGCSRRRVSSCHKETTSLRQVFLLPDTWQPKARMLGKFSCCLPFPTFPPAHLEEQLLENKGALAWDVPKLQPAATGNWGSGRSILAVKGLMGTKQPLNGISFPLVVANALHLLYCPHRLCHSFHPSALQAFPYTPPCWLHTPYLLLSPNLYTFPAHSLYICAEACL